MEENINSDDASLPNLAGVQYMLFLQNDHLLAEKDTFQQAVSMTSKFS